MSRNVPFGKLSTQQLAFWANAKLEGQHWLVWMTLHSHADWQGVVYATQASMARKIGIDKANFSKAVKKLKQVEAIQPRGPYLQLSPYLIEYGDWASAKEVAGRQARRKHYQSGEGTDSPGIPARPSIESAARSSQAPQWKTLPFPREQRPHDSAAINLS